MARARAVGLDLARPSAERIADHALRVLAAEAHLHLTAIRDTAEFLERQIGESLEGVAMLSPDVSGALLDLGSGNGYPGVPVALALTGLRCYLVEASKRRARFLRDLLDTVLPEGVVVDRNVQRAADLGELPRFRVVTTRAARGWERVLPRIAGRLEPDGTILIWAGETVETVVRREAWRRLSIIGKRVLPGRSHSWVWALRSRG